MRDDSWGGGADRGLRTWAAASAATPVEARDARRPLSWRESSTDRVTACSAFPLSRHPAVDAPRGQLQSRTVILSLTYRATLAGSLPVPRPGPARPADGRGRRCGSCRSTARTGSRAARTASCCSRPPPSRPPGTRCTGTSCRTRGRRPPASSPSRRARTTPRPPGTWSPGRGRSGRTSPTSTTPGSRSRRASRWPCPGPGSRWWRRCTTTARSASR